MNVKASVKAITALTLSCCALAVNAQANRNLPPTSVENAMSLGASEVNVSELLAREFDVPSTGVNLGRGWNSFLAQPTATVCVTGVTAPLSISTSSIAYNDVFDREQLLSAMRVSAQAGFGSFGGARAEYSKNVRIDRSRRNIVATVDVIEGGETLQPAGEANGFRSIALVPEALAVLTERGKRPEERILNFYRLCGDSFVSAVHRGARLNALFFVALSENEVKESFKADASGSVGLFSGSASAQSTVERNKTNNSIAIDQTQWGGPQGLAKKPDELINRVETFVKLKPDEARPYIAWATSYRLVSNWPKEFMYTGLTARSVGLLAGQVVRFQDLAELYADAATAPHRYYFPFTPGTGVPQLQKEAVARSDSLYAASACTQNLAMFCALRNSCDIKEIFKADTIKDVCPAAADKDSAHQGAVLSLLLGSSSPALQAAIPSAARTVAAESTALFRVRSPDVFIASSPVLRPPASVAAPGAGGWTPAEIYYRLLAEAPIPRSWSGPTQNTRTPSDASLQMEWFCAAENLACADVAYGNVAGDNPVANTKESAKSIARTWLIRTKLYPLAIGFCKVGGHPMCLRQTDLASLVSTVDVQFGTARNFVSAPPLPAPPPPPAKPRPPRFERPCVPGRLGCPPV